MSEKTDNILLVLAIVAVVVSAVGAGTSYNNLGLNKETWLTGFATTTDNATVNITIISSVAINFTTDNINFGAGRLDLGAPNATLVTIAAVNNTRGNWTNVTTGFVLENIGNQNASIFLMTSKNATSFIGGEGAEYWYNVTNDEAGSCANRTGFALGTWYHVNNTFLGSVFGQEGTYVCSNFSYLDVNDRIRIDLKLVIPSQSSTGDLSDVMTASAYQA